MSATEHHASGEHCLEESPSQSRVVSVRALVIRSKSPVMCCR